MYSKAILGYDELYMAINFRQENVGLVFEKEQK